VQSTWGFLKGMVDHSLRRPLPEAAAAAAAGGGGGAGGVTGSVGEFTGPAAHPFAAAHLLDRASAFRLGQLQWVGVDLLRDANVRSVQDVCAGLGLGGCAFHEGSDLGLCIEETDVLFVDTWHCYGQMRRELVRQ
jgi:hypothetical protein